MSSSYPNSDALHLDLEVLRGLLLLIASIAAFIVTVRMAVLRSKTRDQSIVATHLELDGVDDHEGPSHLTERTFVPYFDLLIEYLI